MDYSIFKPGDRVRSFGDFAHITGTVLFSCTDLVVVDRDDTGKVNAFSAVLFEKIPERTRKFTNVFMSSHLTVVNCSMGSHVTTEDALERRSPAVGYIGMFEQVFEDGELVNTIYHSDAESGADAPD